VRLPAPVPSPCLEYVKRFHYEELVARLRALLRRLVQRREGPRRIGEVFLDPSTREVRVGGRRIELANLEFVGRKPEDGLDKPFSTPSTPDWATEWATPSKQGVPLAGEHQHSADEPKNVEGTAVPPVCEGRCLGRSTRAPDINGLRQLGPFVCLVR
jgi:hypothetical protein